LGRPGGAGGSPRARRQCSRVMGGLPSGWSVASRGGRKCASARFFEQNPPFGESPDMMGTPEWEPGELLSSLGVFRCRSCPSSTC
jgi:hypothetical protein